MRHNASTPWPVVREPPANVDTERTIPARPASLQSDVLVPGAQAVLTGALMAGVLTVLVFHLWGEHIDARPLGVWAVLALVIASVAWLALLGDSRRLLWAVERMTHLDINQDGVSGRPEERLIVVNAESSHRQAEQETARRRKSQFEIFVLGLGAKGTSARAWEREIGREAYTDYRDTLIRLGWAAWNSVKEDGTPNERRGWELTADPAYILERISG